MNIIQKQPNESGAYGQVHHSFSGLDPNAYYEITTDMTDYYAWNGFIIPTIENDVVVSFACNAVAHEAWKVEQAAITIPTDAKSTALSAIEKATTIASLRTAMLNYIDVAGIG